MWNKLTDESLPENGQKVLITDGSIVTAATFDAVEWKCDPGSRWCFDGCGFDGYELSWEFEDNSITHWMPLPAPPKSDNSEAVEQPLTGAARH